MDTITPEVKNNNKGIIIIVLFIMIVLCVGGMYSIWYATSLKIKLTQSDQKVEKLEESLGLRSNLNSNTPQETGMIAPFGTSTAKDSFNLDLETIIQPTPEIAKRINNGEKIKLETKHESRTVMVNESTMFPVKKLSDFKTGDLVKVVYNNEPTNGAPIVAIRVEPYPYGEQKSATSTRQIIPMPIKNGK